MQIVELNAVLCVVFVLCLKNIVYYLSQHTYRYIETASCFCILQPAWGHQYSFLKPTVHSIAYGLLISYSALRQNEVCFATTSK